MPFLFRLSLLSSLITPALIVASCSHLSKNEDMIDGQQETLLLAYMKAQELQSSDASGSCSLYTRLSNEDFPLKTLALLRAHLNCAETKDLPVVQTSEIESQSWLSQIYLQVAEKSAKQNSQDRFLSEIYLKKAQGSSNIKEKVELLQKALVTVEPLFTNRPLIEGDQKFLDDLNNRLANLAPRFIQQPEPKDYFRVGNDWIYARDFKKGRQYLEKIVNDVNFSLEEKYLALRAIRNSYKTEQKKQEYIRAAEKLTAWIEKQIAAKNGFSYQRLNEAALIWVRAEWTEGNIQPAQKILNRYEAKLKSHWPLDELYYIRARMSEEAKNYDQALIWLDKALQESRPKSVYRDRILFSQAWLLRKKSLFQQASLSLEKLKTETSDPFDKNRYSFWLAKSLAQAGESSRAEQEYADLTANDPIGYYGLVAYHELKKDFPALSDKTNLGTSYIKQPNQISRLEFELIRALSYVQENEVLEKLLDQKTLDLKNKSSNVDELWLFYLKSYARAGLYSPLFQKFGTLETDTKAKLLKDHPDLLFPRRFLSLIESSAQKFSIRPELMLSIIRQESAFNPNARSQVDAVGLMQVMPSVAKAHQKWTGIQVDDFHELFLPEKNIPIGASVLAQLEKKYKGQFVLMVAAYNANDKAIQTWLKTRMHDDPLEFIEDIPYEETRAYIKLVLRNFIFYSRMSQPAQTMAFPNWCLEGLQSFKVSTN